MSVVAGTGAQAELRHKQAFGSGAGHWRWVFASLLAGALLLAACGRQTPAPPGPTQTQAAPTSVQPTALSPTAVPTEPPTAVPPTATPKPLAATVNGQPVLLETYQREVARCQAGKALAGVDAADCPDVALQYLVDQEVVAQAAAAAGVTVPDSAVDEAIQDLVSKLGSADALAAWEQTNLYTDAEFRLALQAELLAGQMADRAAAGIGATAEQVHARAILALDETTAQTVLADLQSGADFATEALQYSRDLASRPAGGDLGWFPRGVLTVPEVEQAAFDLPPGETSGVIASRLGFHIVQTLERDPARPLSPDAAQALRAASYAAWLQARMAQADVMVHLNGESQ